MKNHGLENRHGARVYEVRCSILIFLCCLCATILPTALAENAESVVALKAKVGSAEGELGYFLGTSGSGAPSTIAIDPNGNIYVVDEVNSRIQEFNKSGAFVAKISGIARDITTDIHGDLYVPSFDVKSRVIKVFNPAGSLLRTIDLTNQSIRWYPSVWDPSRRVWIHRWEAKYLQLEKITVDVGGSIYLRGIDELIKLNQKGEVVKKWGLDDRASGAGAFIVDHRSNLYLVVPGPAIESYDSDGKFRWKKKCGEEISRVQDEACHLPKWIDREGHLYWFEKKETLVRKTKWSGEELSKFEFDTNHLLLLDGWLRFDIDGNLYFLNSSKTEFWIEKVVLRP